MPLVVFAIAMLVVLGVTYAIDRRLATHDQGNAEWALSNVLQTRAAALSEHLNSLRSEIQLLAENKAVLDAMAAFDTAFDHGEEDSRYLLRRRFISANPNPPSQRFRLTDDGEGTAYSEAHRRFHPALHALTSPHGLYDAFLVNRQGDLVYSVLKEQDYGTNLLSGPWRDTGLARVIRAVLADPTGRSPHFEDFSLYRPSAGQPAAFMAMPLRAAKGDQFLGVLALQVPQEQVRYILQAGLGAGHIGDIYLVGPDYLLRSDMPDRQWGVMLRTKREHEGITAALHGQAVVLASVSAAGEAVIGGYMPFDFLGQHYALALEVPKAWFAAGDHAVTAWIAGLLSAAAALSSLFLWWRDRIEAQSVEDMKRLLQGRASDDLISEGRMNEGFQGLAEAVVQFRERSRHLLNAEQDYVRLFEAFNFGTFRRSASGVLLQVNETMARIYGYRSPQELLWASQSGEWKPYVDDDPDSNRYTVWNQSDSGARVEAEAMRKDGTPIWISESYRIVRDAGGKIAFYEGVLSDITERHRIEEDIRTTRRELEETTNRLQTALNTMPSGLVMFDRDMVIQVVSDLVPKYYNIPPEIMRPGESLRTCIDYFVTTGEFHGLDADREFERLRQLYTSGQSFRFERELLGGRIMEVNGNPLEGGGVVLNIVDVTEIRRAEQIVTRARQRLLDAIEAMDDAFTIWDSNEGLVSYNSGLIQLQPELKGVVHTGMSFEEFLDCVIRFRLEGQDERDIGAWRQEQLTVFRKGGIFEVERSNGAWHRQSYVMTRDGGRVGIRADISQRKSWEETLVQSEQKFRRLIEGSAQGVLICTPTGRPLYVNPALAQVFGYDEPSAMMVFDPISELIDVRDRQAIISRGFDVASGEGTEERGRYRGIGRKGNIVWLDMSIQKIDWQGMIALQCVCSDITKQVLIEHEIQWQSEIFQKAVDGMPQGVALLDPDGQIRLVNDRALQLVGLSRDDVVTGGSLRNLLATADGPVAGRSGPKLEDINKLLAQDRSFDYERQTSDGKVLEIRGNRLPEGGVVVTLVDITERKQFEEEIQQARREADAANAAKSQFLAVMSHEIRTPMNGVMAMSELMAQTSLSVEQQHIAAVIQESASLLLDILNDILDFSKIEANKLMLESVGFSLVDLVEHAPMPMATRAYEKGLEVISHVAPELPDHVVGDPTRIRQILVNLLSNAIKFTERGNVRIRAVDAGGDDRQRRIRIEVTDTGVGIDLATADGLFEPFRQLDGSTAREFGGTGLGLAISKRLAEAMGGQLTVESELGGGATFALELPLTILPERRVRQNPDLAGARILLVVPDPDLGESLRAYGRYLGAEVDLVSAVEDADRLLQPEGADASYELLIIDDRLNQGYGLQWGEKVLKRFPAMRGVLIVGFLEGQRRDQAMQAGFAHCIGKPVTRQSYWNAIAVTLGVMDEEQVAPLREAASPQLYDSPSRQDAEKEKAVILIVEDNATNQEVVRRQMDRLGFVIDVVENGREALDRLQDHYYGLVFTDCHMPVMDGYSLTRAVREQEQKVDAHLPIVALTADALVGTARSCKEAGMDDYLAKPVQLAQLEAAVRRHLPKALELRSLAKPRTPRRKNGNDREIPYMTKQDEIFDRTPLEIAFGDFNDEARGFLRDFMDSLPSHYQAINHALAQGDVQAVRETAHALKGASGSIGARALSRISADIESAAKDRDMERLRQLLPELDGHADTLRAVLSALSEQR